MGGRECVVSISISKEPWRPALVICCCWVSFPLSCSEILKGKTQSFGGIWKINCILHDTSTTNLEKRLSEKTACRDADQNPCLVFPLYTPLYLYQDLYCHYVYRARLSQRTRWTLKVPFNPNHSVSLWENTEWGLNYKYRSSTKVCVKPLLSLIVEFGSTLCSYSYLLCQLGMRTVQKEHSI